MGIQRSRRSAPVADTLATREALIQAATQLFAQKGFNGTSVKELADLAGVNISLVSYHFGGKEGLYRACLEMLGKDRLAIAQKVLQKPTTLGEFRFRLRMYAEEVLTFHVEYAELMKIVHSQCDMEDPLVKDIFKKTFLKGFDTLVDFFRGARSAGVLRKEVDPQIAAATAFGSIIHFGRTDPLAKEFYDITIRDKKTRDAVIDHIMSCVIHGLVNPEAKP